MDEAEYDIKQSLDEVFVICGIINVEVRVISRAEGEADNSYRALIILHITKTESDTINVLLYIHKHGSMVKKNQCEITVSVFKFPLANLKMFSSCGEHALRKCFDANL